MSKLQERLNHIGELVKGLSEQSSGNMTILNSNCQMLGNRLEDLEKKVQDLETKTASDLSRSTISKTETVPKENSGKPNNQTFDRERALELLDIIDFEYWDCVTNKVMENSIEELRQLLGNE